jgi:hypothetical protein
LFLELLFRRVEWIEKRFITVLFFMIQIVDHSSTDLIFIIGQKHFHSLLNKLESLLRRRWWWNSIPLGPQSFAKCNELSCHMSMYTTFRVLVCTLCGLALW